MGNRAIDEALPTLGRSIAGQDFARHLNCGRFHKTLGFFFVSQQRLHFAAQFLVSSISGFKELSATGLIQLQSLLAKLFHATPNFRLHDQCPVSIPATTKFLLISSPELRCRWRRVTLPPFLRRLAHRRISTLQLCFFFHPLWTMRSRHRRGRPDSRRLGRTRTEPLPE